MYSSPSAVFTVRSKFADTAGVIAVVVGAPFIFFLDLLFCVFFGQMQTVHDSFHSVFHWCAEENSEAVFVVSKGVVRAASYDHAVSFCSKFSDDL